VVKLTLVKPETSVASNEEDRPAAASSDPRRDSHLGPVSDRGLAIFMALLVLALVLGYLLLNKLVQISQEEDCGLAHRRNCGAVVAPDR
jgi:hypothetical protein